MVQPTPPQVPLSVRETIILAVIAALSAATVTSDGGAEYSAPAGLTVFQERTRPIEIASLPSIMVYADDDAPKSTDEQLRRSPLVEKELALSFECRAQGSASVTPDAALDPVLVWASLAVFADETFGGLANGVTEGRTVWSSREGDVPVASAKWSITVKFRTSRLDPTSKT